MDFWRPRLLSAKVVKKRRFRERCESIDYLNLLSGWLDVQIEIVLTTPDLARSGPAIRLFFRQVKTFFRY